MNSNTTNDGLSKKSFSPKREIDWLELLRKVCASKKLIFKACGVGAVVGLIIALSIPREYTASMLVAHENSRKRASSSLSALTDMGDDVSSPTPAGRDAIYPSLYLHIVNSTPFLLRLSDIKVRCRQDSIAIPLSLYVTKHQTKPWWSAVTSAPFKLLGLGMSLISRPGDAKPEAEKVRMPQGTPQKSPLRLTRKELAAARIIGSRIDIEVDKKKRTIALSVKMQDPLVAATVVDTLQILLRKHVTEYRTSKARRLLKYNEMICKEAQAEYYAAQSKYTEYADANQSLVMQASRSELLNLQSEMNLAYLAYNQLEKQVQAAKARVERVTPVYTVIQPASVPLRPSKPGRMGILAGCVLLSAAGAIGWILFAKEFIGRMRKTRATCKPGRDEHEQEQDKLQTGKG